MRKKMITVILPLLLVTACVTLPAVSLASEGKPVFNRTTANKFLSSGGGAKSDLCEYEKCGNYSALEWATAWAAHYFGGTAYGSYCEGPFENREEHTQWACYGTDSGGFDWQVNVGPYGEPTYHRKLG